MKKFLILSLAMLVAACASDVPGNITDTGAKISKSDCENVKGVKDIDNGGKIYYTRDHRLYDFIKLDTAMGDKSFCNIDLAKKAGFSRIAPQYFEDSAYKMVGCLETESEGGSCHTYIAGIYQSLRIYNKVCGPAERSKSELASTYISYAQKTKNGMDVSKYSGATSAFISRYGC